MQMGRHPHRREISGVVLLVLKIQEVERVFTSGKICFGTFSRRFFKSFIKAKLLYSRERSMGSGFRSEDGCVFFYHGCSFHVVFCCSCHRRSCCSSLLKRIRVVGSARVVTLHGRRFPETLAMRTENTTPANTCVH